jgi:hypothetical protein
MEQPIFLVRGADHSVEFWSDQRLPFEPKGTMLEARAALRAALRRLQADPRRGLIASYSSVESGFCDVENILFYNVGAASFAGLASRAIRFERHWSRPPLSPCGRTFFHQHRYEVAEAATVRPDVPSCSMSFPLSLPRMFEKPHSVWWEAARAVSHIRSPFTGPFALHVAVDLRRPVSNLAAILKPLLDGLISALHRDRVPHPEVIRRLSERMGWSLGEIEARLASPTTPLLGDRDLVSVYRDFVKWNPADELCEICTLEQRTGSADVCQVQIWPRGS